MLAAVGVLALFGATAPARADPAISGTVEVSRPVGDVYDERTTDGDAYPQSLGVRAFLTRGDLAATLEYRRNVYLTESAGPGTLTRYARLDGGTGTSAPFLARETSFEARVARRLGTGSLYAGIGAVRTWTNYNYPVLTGARRRHRAARLRGGGHPCVRFGVLLSVGIRSIRVGGRLESHAHAEFRMMKADGGVVVRSARSRVYGVLGYGFEQRSGHALPSDVRLIRSDPYVAVGTRW